MYEDIISYKEFMAICFENGIKREWEIDIRYQIYVAIMMNWIDVVEYKTLVLEENLTLFMTGKFN